MFTNNNYIFKSTWKLRRINYCTIFAWRHMLVLTCYDKYSSFVFTKGLMSNGVSLSNTLLLYSLNPCKAARSWHFDHEWTQRFYWPSSQVLCSLLSRWARFSRPKLQYLIRVCGMQIRQVPLMPLLLSAQLRYPRTMFVIIWLSCRGDGKIAANCVLCVWRCRGLSGCIFNN